MLKKIFQTEWHNIKFTEFSKLSKMRIADSEFYKSFYVYFFSKYDSYEELDTNWKVHKKKVANYIADNYELLKKKILALGVGTGYIEKELYLKGVHDLYIQEIRKEPLKWIKEYIPEQQIFAGFFPTCISSSHKFDLIYISGIEYVLKDDELIQLLKNVKSYLKKGGKCLLLSYTFEEDKKILKEIIDTIAEFKKDMMRLSSIILNSNNKEQFWGYIRSISRFKYLFQKAGFNKISIKELNENIGFKMLIVESEK